MNPDTERGLRTLELAEIKRNLVAYAEQSIPGERAIATGLLGVLVIGEMLIAKLDRYEKVLAQINDKIDGDGVV